MLWLGDPRHLPRDIPHRVVDRTEDACGIHTDALPVLATDFGTDATHGTADPRHAQRVIDVIAQGVDLVQRGAALALCTAPIHKKALQDGAGFAYPGHTEYLAALAGDVDVVMMLASDQLRVVPTTIHIALAQVPQVLTPALLRRTIEITAYGLRRQFSIANPRLAIAGLNPHAGEGGAMGREELDWIAPLITQMRGEGFDLAGPLPADTMFHAAARARYDAAIAMYHDQALIPIKTLDFDRGVNVTLGLPFIRTSPDHGTAFDIAGQGIANPTSMIEAIRLAHRMAETR
ncbi:4-hydroxythreonine-4-phosphate dehydrogenase [Sulfitobacter brevis]|uniref:4-hydroxythreonine-4-phosphate dehydrogenase n=2 Tax=Sulfitobacter brevis TaxID=74348 RepID=A0A1I1UTZ3_9RHOB|nr:4-hydroxythreonine-4-phosphate dehydrogenase [Sulfitobacter brevis]